MPSERGCVAVQLRIACLSAKWSSLVEHHLWIGVHGGKRAPVGCFPATQSQPGCVDDYDVIIQAVAGKETHMSEAAIRSRVAASEKVTRTRGAGPLVKTLPDGRYVSGYGRKEFTQRAPRSKMPGWSFRKARRLVTSMQISRGASGVAGGNDGAGVMRGPR